MKILEKCSKKKHSCFHAGRLCFRACVCRKKLRPVSRPLHLILLYLEDLNFDICFTKRFHIQKILSV